MQNIVLIDFNIFKLLHSVIIHTNYELLILQIFLIVSTNLSVNYRACFKSSIKSSTCSIPTDIRIRFSGMGVSCPTLVLT